ncbi:hypothetical protein [Nostoc sp.]|uniref:hypothetical protein n=1 Tax=Nostoc sp. TaxID=1180 RepID=UPI002FF8A8C3
MVSKKKASQITKVFKNQQRAKETFTVVPRQTNRRYAFMALILCLIIVACTNTYQSSPSPVNKLSSQSTDLRIWWDKGSNLEEDEALKLLISNWEKQSGKKVKLTFYTNDELSEKTNRALQAHNQPDIVMSSSAERELIPHLAWDGKLADVSDVLEPVKSLYSDTRPLA